MERAILHSDINSCYASIERLFEPSLGEKPFAVCGDKELRHGIVLSKDEKAKAAGVKTGMAIWQAKQQCPGLEIVAPHFERYEEYTAKVRKIYTEYTDLCEPFGMDECWLDITGCIACPDPVKTAEEIRQRVKDEIGITVSVGVSWNKIFAKLGSDYKKPDAVTVIDREHFRDMVWCLPASDMLMVGRSTAKSLNRMGISTIGDIAAANPEVLKNALGKPGLRLYAYANGMDLSPVRRIGENPPPKSIGNSTTMPEDINTAEEARRVIILLAESVASRLRREKLMCRTVELSLRDTELAWSSHRMKLRYATDITAELIDYGMQLFLRCHDFSRPLRSMGLRGLELVNADEPEQLDIFIDYVNKDKQRKIDAAVDKVRKKYGNSLIQRASIFGSIPSDFGFCALPQA